MGIKDKDDNAAYMREYYKRNKAAIRERMKAYYAENKEQILAQGKAKIKSDPEKYREIFRLKGREWEVTHPGYHRALNRKIYAESKEAIIKEYGGKCYCCGEATREFLTLDHIHRDGKFERERFGNRLYIKIAKEGFPKDRYRLACMNCNWAERYGALCPHKEKGEEMRLISSCG